MPDALTIREAVVAHLPAEQVASVRLCRPRDVAAVAALAVRCAWRRRRDAPVVERFLRLVLWPATATLLALEGRSLWMNSQRTAILSTRPSTDRTALRLMPLLLSGVVLPIAVLGAIGLAAGAENEVLVACLTLMVLLLDLLRRRRRVPVLAEARRNLRGPGVVEATNLVAASPGAGVALARGLCAVADATGTTIVAEASGPARQRLYRRLGFEIVAQASGDAVLVRTPLCIDDRSKRLPPLSLDGTR
ncbi:MAG: hypothetical protein AB1679_18925 [Actinomycetota bacterium]